MPSWPRRFGPSKRIPGGLSRFSRPADERMSSNQDQASQPEKIQSRKRGLNENYARELLELHTLGVNGGYTQRDVTEVARCFTGWTIARPRRGAEFAFIRHFHDDGEKLVLGHSIPAGGGIKDGERIVDILAHHPSTARFLASKLARRLIGDTPPQALVDRIAGTYRATDGDIPSILKTIFTSPEFNSLESYHAKVKTPFELVVSAIRSLGGETDAGRPILQAISQMGEPLFLCQPPTGYPEVAEAWVNTGALLNRLNFSLALADNRIPGTVVNLERFAKAGGSGQEVLNDVSRLLFQNKPSGQTLNILVEQLRETQDTEGMAGDKRSSRQAARLVGLLLGSPEFQRH